MLTLKTNRKLQTVLILVLTIQLLYITPHSSFLEEEENDYFFNLVAKTNYYSADRLDYLHMMKQQLARIGIRVDVIISGPPTFIGELIAYREFDIAYVGLAGGGRDPDFTGVYNENGSLNLFGYHTDMDYNETLGTGLNEWYMKQGILITPPNSDERIEHYWNWEQYLMDNILPCYPCFAPKSYSAYWDTLHGYNISKGIRQSWGNMSWQASHPLQQSTDEFVIADYAWSDLNPMFQDDSSSAFINYCILDPLFYFDDDNKCWPHLAESYSYINETYLRINTRDGITWQDFDGFSNEEFNAEDVFFTLYSWKEVSNDQRQWDWIEDIKLIDDNTIDIFIDGDTKTPQNEPYAPALADLNCLMLPEHYLNQTQLVDGVTPDITHSSWNTFATHCFGTGLFELDTFIEGVETKLTVDTNSWWLNSTITNDTPLNWNRRFGDFTNYINTLKIRIINNDYTRLSLFTAGELDYYSFNNLRSFSYNTQEIDGIAFQTKTTQYFGFYGFNMRPVRDKIGNPEPCEDDPSITKGLAIRKAICYAIDREEINKIVNGGEYTIINHPIYETMGVWCNPNIITYNHNLEMAKHYMALAGYDVPDHIYTTSQNPSGWIYAIAGISYVLGAGILLFGVILIRKKRSLK